MRALHPQPRRQQPKHWLPGGFSSKTQTGRLRGSGKATWRGFAHPKPRSHQKSFIPCLKAGEKASITLPRTEGQGIYKDRHLCAVLTPHARCSQDPTSRAEPPPHNQLRREVRATRTPPPPPAAGGRQLLELSLIISDAQLDLSASPARTKDGGTRPG